MPEAVGERSEERPTAATGPSARAVTRLRAVTRAAALFAAAVGVLVFVGWLLDVRLFVQVLPGQVAMVPNTAIAFILAGLALWWRAGIDTRSSLYASGAAAAACVLLGLLALAEYFSGLSFGIDELLFRDRAGLTGVFPGRMAVLAAVSFVAIGSALFLSSLRRARWATEALAVVPGLLALISLAGYAYGVRSIDWIGKYKGMAVHTAAAFLVLSLGVLLSRGDRGFARLMVSDTVGGIVARRIIPVALGVPLVLGWLHLVGQRAGLYGTELGTALYAASNAVVLLAIFRGIAAALMRTDQERKRAEEALRASEQRIRAVMEGARDALVVSTTDGIVLEINRAAEALFGRPRSEVVGRHFLETLAPEERAKVRRSFEGDVVRGGAQGQESVVLRADGKTIPIEVSVSRVEIGGEQLMFAIIRDVSERKHAEEVRARLAAIVEFSDDAIISETLDGVITSWNAGAEALYGHAAAEAIGQPEGLYVPEDRSGEIAAILEKIRGGEVLDRLETVRVRKDGKRIDVSLKVSPVRDASGAVIGASAIARDITERRRADKSLRESVQRYRSLFESMLHGFAHCEMLFEDGEPRDFVYLDVNATFEKVTGLTGVVGKRVTQVIPGIRESNPELFETMAGWPGPEPRRGSRSSWMPWGSGSPSPPTARRRNTSSLCSTTLPSASAPRKP